MRAKTFKIIPWGGIGDALLTTPSLKAIKEQYPNSKLKLYCSDRHRQIFQNNPYIDSIKVISYNSFFDRIRYFYNSKNFFQPSYGFLSPGKFYSKSAIEIIAEMFDLKFVEKKIQIFLTDEEIQWGKDFISKYPNPITFQVTAQSSENKHWDVDKWEALIKSMPDYTFIHLGLGSEKKIEGAIDMRGKTSLRESFSLIRHSKSFVGIESSLAHATNAFGTPGVVLFGSSTPAVWGHSNNINIYKNISCAPCIHGLQNEPCFYGRHCMDLIKVEEVKRAIEKQVAETNIETFHELNLQDVVKYMAS